MKHLSFSLLVLLTLAACNPAADTQSDAVSSSQRNDLPPEEQNDQNIRLNDGEKWPVNEEMKPHILNAESLLVEYINSQKTDYNVLAQQLDEHNMSLINSCTMRGQGHDELHKWLYPHMTLINTLKETNNETTADSVITELQASFGQYHTYFQ
jgi:hypothetical protein